MSDPTVDDRRSARFARFYDRGLALAGAEGFLGPLRRSLVGGLTGRVLEIGAGTGANLGHYHTADEVLLAEPLPSMRSRLEQRVSAREGGIPVRVLDARAEALPVEDGGVDAVVSTLVLCSVEQVDVALAEVRRVLAPGGVFAFLEHSRGSGLKRVVQTAITPLTIRYAGNCHHDRDLPAHLGRAGFADVAPIAVRASTLVRMLPEWPFVAGRATAP